MVFLDANPVIYLIEQPANLGPKATVSQRGREVTLEAGDAFHASVTSFSRTLGTSRLVTTDEVMMEVLNWFSRWGPFWRGKAAALPYCPILGYSAASFRATGGVHRSLGSRAALVSSRRRRGAKRGASLKRAVSPDLAAVARPRSEAMNWSRLCLDSDSVGSISMAPCTMSGK